MFIVSVIGCTFAVGVLLACGVIDPSWLDLTMTTLTLFIFQRLAFAFWNAIESRR